MRAECDSHPVEKVGAELRGMMHWIQEAGIKPATKKKHVKQT